MVSTLILPRWFIHKQASPIAGDRHPVELLGWMKTSEKQVAYCCESNLRAAAAQGQCRRLVQRCGSCGKGFL